MSETTKIPYRQIRAHYDEVTITVYQAYSSSIAEAAVREQKLSASPEFLYSRMTWIKPSWCWTMYRSGYALKDNRQTRILALRMTHANFQALLSMACVTDGHTAGGLSSEEKSKAVRVQWDPERGPKLEVKPYRSIQIGIGRAMSQKWVEEWIESIEDVTERAALLKKCVDEGAEEEDLAMMRAMPTERVYEVSNGLRAVLKMDELII